MFDFLKNLFKPKSTQASKPIQLQEIDKNHRILKDYYQIEKEKAFLKVFSSNTPLVIDYYQIEKEKEKEKEILKVFSNNLPLFHRVIVPVFNLAKELNVGVLDFSSLVKQGFLQGNINTLQQYINSIYKTYRNSLYTDLGRRFGTELANEFSETLFDECMIPFFELSYIPKEDMEKFQETFKSLLNNERIYNEVQVFLKEQIKVCFIKYFTFESYIKEIDNIDELTKILINAAYKYQDVEVVSKETYDIFLDYTQLNENNFPLDIYNEFIAVYLSSKNVCRDFYKEDEIALDFDYNSMNMADIINTII